MKQPTRAQEISFFIKSRYFIGKRLLRNLGSPQNILRDPQMIGPYRLSESVSRLKISNELEHQKLQDGKIHNLKVACQELHGLRISRNEEFSFWKILGRPTTDKGYTVGREIRYGCVIPTVAGGLCQLSGALYEAATQAGFQITERHAHTATAEGMDIPESRDCTIFWNYVDFKFKPHLDISLSAVVTEDELVVSFYSAESCNQVEERKQNPTEQKKKTIESCETCHEFECHQKQKLTFSKTIVLSPDFNQEEREFLNKQGKKIDYLWIPSRLSEIWKLRLKKDGNHIFFFRKGISFHLWLRLLFSRWHRAQKKTVAEQSLTLWKMYSESVESLFQEKSAKGQEVEFILDQRLVPWLWQKGLLVDKKYSVFFRHLPMVEMQKRLNKRAEVFPQDQTLKDFRVPASVLDAEWSGLKSAQKLYTDHDELASLYERTVHFSPTRPPESTGPQSFLPQRPYLFFPGPSMGREGKHFVHRLIKQTHLSLCLLSADQQDAEFWKDVPVHFFEKDDLPWNQIAAVVHPTIFEGRNSLHRQAIARGIPVMGSKGLGLHLRYPIVIIDEEQIFTAAKGLPIPLIQFDSLHVQKS